MGHQLTTAQIVVEVLKKQGVDHLYCMPGVQNDDFFDALWDSQRELVPIHTRHEQGAAYMALGAALATGRPQTYCVVPGPGMLNSTAALATAYACNAPVLALVGQIPSDLIGRGLGALHDTPGHLEILQTLTKFAAPIRSPEETLPQCTAALSAMLTGRRRPVALEVPMDVWPQTCDVTLPDGAVAEGEPTEFAHDQIREAAKVIGRASNPLIWVGSGALHASEEVRLLAEMLEAPVVANCSGRGTLDSRHYLSHTQPAGAHFWRDADVVLGIGTRLYQRYEWGTKGLRFVLVDNDPAQLSKFGGPDVAVLADARVALTALLEEVPRHNRRRDSRKTELETLKTNLVSKFAKLEPIPSYLEAIYSVLPDDGVLVADVTQVGLASQYAFPIHQPRTFLWPTYYYTLGWGYATALGAQVARKNAPVVAVMGDGGFMFNVQELATAAHYNIPTVAVVFNDNAFGNVQRLQQRFYGRTIVSDLTNPDFVKLAEAHGILGMRASNPNELKKALRDGIDSRAPCLIEVPCGEMPNPWEFMIYRNLR